MKRRTVLVATSLALVASVAGVVAWKAAPTKRNSAPRASIPEDASLLQTAHYRVHSTATPAQTREIAAAAESLHAAYLSLFAGHVAPSTTPLILVLYRDADEFARNNRSRPWAEAYYLRPACYAYYGSGNANPYHWMLHEAVHQLNTEVAGWRLPAWANEGIAGYLGASWLEEGVLTPGRSDPDTYPIWWLSRMKLTGSLDADVAAVRFIPLRELVEGRGPGIDQHVNLYYLHYWSLSHFLFHHEDGTYADAYKQLLALGAATPDFERLIGPIEEIEKAWYAYLLGAIAKMQAYEAEHGIVR
ncbi:hypothetical protein [Pseudoxanthomonas sp. Root630]|uniref:hypothetical protein n=1 Tax=Pseudoxanthomonas sp. Root630 TaxID=1736574 RepID=UPI0007038C2D|nr:hypothetical protein [Pseudoxanthomonas sp. Root630]KRA45072.1 hypothetical protein ASD72_07335 [Pseudoxanthomonas sp. Root630]